jgi:hypothetical protein
VYDPSAYWNTLPAPPEGGGTAALAERVFEQAFRRDFRRPGFALVSFTGPVGSSELRALMVRLKEALGERYHRATGRHLVYRSMARFDQQVTTKFHIDGAPDESYLMLGYEPSAVDSRLAVADYTRAAHDLDIDPRRFLDEYNPMYDRGERRLAAYVTRLDVFDPSRSHILLLNNSRLPFRQGGDNFLGVMHQATIVSPDPGKHRVVNSTMLTAADDLADESVPRAVQEEFVRTREVSGYGKVEDV